MSYRKEQIYSDSWGTCMVNDRLFEDGKYYIKFDVNGSNLIEKSKMIQEVQEINEIII